MNKNREKRGDIIINVIVYEELESILNKYILIN